MRRFPSIVSWFLPGGKNSKGLTALSRNRVARSAVIEFATDDLDRRTGSLIFLGGPPWDRRNHSGQSVPNIEETVALLNGALGPNHP